MSQNTVLIPFQKHRHNHATCVKTAMVDAENACLKLGLRLTSIRREILKMVWSSHAPIKAYELLEQMQQQNPKTAPPTVYRALEFLQKAGLVHRIESLNAYVGCGDPSEPHLGQFLICQHCGAVAEINAKKITKTLNEQAEQLGFSAQQQLVEIMGTCPQCA